ncbi:MAG: menaquinone biosynthesis decarboxylase [Thermodesulfobacteriota bacterium]|nr:menaquinone biosynthesis decarboxylase [Thermodesulfobacteriota bacterium]
MKERLIFDNFNNFLEFIETKGELVRIKHPVDPYLEITEITNRVVKKGGPALLFEKVKGSGFPLAINVFGSKKRMCFALGVDNIEEIGEEIKELFKSSPPTNLRDKFYMLLKLANTAKVFPKITSFHAPSQEIIINSPDLNNLPILHSWPKDAGPFITLPLVIIKDPETGARNCGMYRLQKFSSNTLGIHWQLHKDGRRIFNKYKSLNKKMEIVASLGGDPVLTYTATAPMPPEVDELLFAGFIRKKGVGLIKGITVDIDVPVSADFVLEGYVDPEEEFKTEGPFGDHTGFYSEANDFPVMHVTAITHRENPVYPATIVGIPPMEDGYIGWATERIFLPLLQMLFPEIIDIHLPAEGGFHNLAIISIKKSYPGHGTKIMHSLWGLGQMMLTKCFVVVENEIDIHDLKTLLWYVLNNVDPKRDITFWQGPLDELDHSSNYPFYGGKVGIDATKKWREEGYTRKWPEMIKMKHEVIERVNEIWERLGINL